MKRTLLLLLLTGCATPPEENMEDVARHAVWRYENLVDAFEEAMEKMEHWHHRAVIIQLRKDIEDAKR